MQWAQIWAKVPWTVAGGRRAGALDQGLDRVAVMQGVGEARPQQRHLLEHRLGRPRPPTAHVYHTLNGGICVSQDQQREGVGGVPDMDPMPRLDVRGMDSLGSVLDPVGPLVDDLTAPFDGSLGDQQVVDPDN